MKTVFISVFILFFALAGYSQYQVSGHVHDTTHAPVAGALVTRDNQEEITVTDATGFFVFRNVPAGKHIFSVRILGYHPQSREIEVKHHITHFDFHLSINAVEMDPVKVKGEVYEERIKKQPLHVVIVHTSDMDPYYSPVLTKTLEHFPGIRSGDIGSGSGKPLIRGMSGNRIAVYDHGIRQQDQQWGEEHGLAIDESNAETIEIIKGPASVKYGSDALGGVLHFLPSPMPEKRTLSASLTSLFRSNNMLWGTTAQLAVRKNNPFLKVSFSERYFGDYRVTADSFTYLTYKKPIPDQILKNTAGHHQNFSMECGLAGKQVSSRLLLSRVYRKTGFFPGSHGIPSLTALQPDSSRYNIDLPYQEVEHLKIISNNRMVAGKRMLLADIGFQHNDHREYSWPHTHGLQPVPEGNLEMHFMLQTFSANVSMIFLKNNLSEITGGISFESQKNTIGGYSFFLPAFRQSSQSAYLTGSRNIAENHTVQMGLRYDLAAIHISEYRDPYVAMIVPADEVPAYEYRSRKLDKTFHALSFSAGWINRISSHLILKAHVGKGFRTPTAIELSANGIHHGSFRHERGDASLLPEESYQTDLSLQGNYDLLTFSVNPYFSYFPRYIFLNPSGNFSWLPEAGQIWQYKESPSLRMGSEIEGMVKINRHVAVLAAGEYLHTLDISTGYPVPYSPPARILASFRYEPGELEKYKKNYVMYTITAYGPKHNVARNELTTGGAFIHDVSAGTTFHAGKTEIVAAIQINNLFNTFYFNHISYYRLINIPEPGRNIQLIIKVPFTTGW